MLNIEVNRSADAVERYFDRELAVSDYLMKDPGVWPGLGSERPGLRGPVRRRQSVALLRNEDPASGKRWDEKAAHRTTSEAQFPGPRQRHSPSLAQSVWGRRLSQNWRSKDEPKKRVVNTPSVRC
jgi:hypothetical protein